jgi:hypothetical protein
MAAQEIEAAYCLFCEFVRGEPHGKTTAIGMYGDTCRFFGQPPGMLPNLGLHVFIRNPGRRRFAGVLTVTWPGRPRRDEVRFAAAATEGSTGHGLNCNFATPQLLEEGDIVAHLLIEADPPVQHEYRLRVCFEPPPVTQLSAT